MPGRVIYNTKLTTVISPLLWAPRGVKSLGILCVQFISNLMKLFENLLNLVAPHNCLNCTVEGMLLCNWCAEDAYERLPQRCYRCFKASAYNQTCPACRRLSPIKQLWASTSYGGLSKKLVQTLKFHRAGSAAAKVIAEDLNERLPYFEKIIITYVPTSTSRVRQRGYDQAKFIAKEFALLRKLPYGGLLGRHGQSRQTGSRKKDRAAQLKSAFYPRNNLLINKAEILLIDDVLTTGATMEAAARTLRKAGAKSIYGAVFAQTPPV